MERIPYDSVLSDIIKQLKSGAFLSVKADNELSVMTIAWASIGFIWGKQVMTIVVRPTRYTFNIIEKAKDFTVSVPINDMARELELCGTASGRECDKLQKCNLETISGKKVHSSIIAVAGIHIECKIIYKSTILPEFLSEECRKLYPSNDFHTMYFGEIIDCYNLEDAVTHL